MLVPGNPWFCYQLHTRWEVRNGFPVGVYMIQNLAA